LDDFARRLLCLNINRPKELTYDALRDLARRGVLRRLCLAGLVRRHFFRAAGLFVATGKATDAAEIDGKNVGAPMTVSEAMITSAKREIFFKAPLHSRGR
jgi:hypothetical protein